jgi:AcrR family transcriptional regulator
MSGIREKQLLRRKQETLDVALRLLQERGYSNLNMDELAEEAGISKPTLYQYFNSKDELVAKAVVRMFEKMEAQISNLDDKSPLQQLEEYLRAMLRARADKRVTMAPADMEVMRTLHTRYPYMAEHLQLIREKLAVIVEQAQALGEIDPSFPTWVVVNLLFSLQRIINNPFAREETPRSEAELAAATESIIRLFKQGVRLAESMPA